jgi:hypothetical protein
MTCSIGPGPNAVLESALRKLRQGARASGKAALFDALTNS